MSPIFCKKVRRLGQLLGLLESSRFSDLQESLSYTNRLREHASLTKLENSKPTKNKDS